MFGPFGDMSSPHSILDVETCSYPVASASGAQLQSVRARLALDFLERFGQHGDPLHSRLDARGAFEDCSTLIGACTETKGPR